MLVNEFICKQFELIRNIGGWATRRGNEPNGASWNQSHKNPYSWSCLTLCSTTASILQSARRKQDVVTRLRSHGKYGFVLAKRQFHYALDLKQSVLYTRAATARNQGSAKIIACVSEATLSLPPCTEKRRASALEQPPQGLEEVITCLCSCRNHCFA